MESRSRFPDRAFRIGDVRHPLFDGTGAFLKGGRWNSPGKSVIYASETYAGALLESLVHLNFDEVPGSYGYIDIPLPDAISIEKISAEQIPGWNSEDLRATRAYGDEWHKEKRSAILLVPSVVTTGIEHNLLINPEHPEAQHLQPGPIKEVIWDARLFRAAK